MGVVIGTGDERKLRLITLGLAILGLAAALAWLAVGGLSPLGAHDPGPSLTEHDWAPARGAPLGLDEAGSAGLELFRRYAGNPESPARLLWITHAVHRSTTGTSTYRIGVGGAAENSPGNGTTGVQGVGRSSRIGLMDVFGQVRGTLGKVSGVWRFSGNPNGWGISAATSAYVEGKPIWNAKTSYISVGPAAFQPSETTDYFRRDTSLIHFGDQFASGPVDHTKSGDYYALLNLPHGATITKMTFGWADDLPTDALMELWRQETLDPTSLRKMASASTSGDSLVSDSTEDTTIDHAPIDNSKYTYYLFITLPGSDPTFGEFIYVNGVLLEYTIQGPY